MISSTHLLFFLLLLIPRLIFQPFVIGFNGVYFGVKCLSRFSCDQLFATLWTIVHQAPLSMESSGQEYWSWVPCPPPGESF